MLAERKVIVACANEATATLPPMVIFKGERLNAEYTKNQVPNTLYGMSKRVHQQWIFLLVVL